jgi:hypothetical protein
VAVGRHGVFDRLMVDAPSWFSSLRPLASWLTFERERERGGGNEWSSFLALVVSWGARQVEQACWSVYINMQFSRHRGRGNQPDRYCFLCSPFVSLRGQQGRWAGGASIYSLVFLFPVIMYTCSDAHLYKRMYLWTTKMICLKISEVIVRALLLTRIQMNRFRDKQPN